MALARLSKRSNWQSRSAARARMRKKVNTKSHVGASTKTKVSKKEFLEALPGTGGIKIELAAKLGVCAHTIASLLKREDWSDVLVQYIAEVDTTCDEAEKTILHSIKDRKDLATATLNARWYLSRLKKEMYGDVTRTVLEGGATPIQTQNLNAHVMVNMNDINLPLDVRRSVLEAMERQNAAKADADGQNAGESQPQAGRASVGAVGAAGPIVHVVKKRGFGARRR